MPDVIDTSIPGIPNVAKLLTLPSVMFQLVHESYKHYMALVQFNGALVPQLGEKPRLLSSAPAVARATYADAKFLAPKTGYVCKFWILFCRYHVIHFRFSMTDM